MTIEEERDRYKAALEKIREEYGNWQSSTNPYLIANDALHNSSIFHREEIQFKGDHVEWRDGTPMGDKRPCPPGAIFYCEWKER